MRFRLRTLLILLAVLPPLVWVGCLTWRRYEAARPVNDGVSVGFDPKTGSFRYFRERHQHP